MLFLWFLRLLPLRTKRIRRSRTEYLACRYCSCDESGRHYVTFVSFLLLLHSLNHSCVVVSYLILNIFYLWQVSTIQNLEVLYFSAQLSKLEFIRWNGHARGPHTKVAIRARTQTKLIGYSVSSVQAVNLTSIEVGIWEGIWRRRRQRRREDAPETFLRPKIRAPAAPNILSFTEWVR